MSNDVIYQIIKDLNEYLVKESMQSKDDSLNIEGYVAQSMIRDNIPVYYFDFVEGLVKVSV